VSGSITKLAKTTVSRGLHGTATLLPDASVFFAGENREALIQPDDPSFPLMSSYAGLLPRGDPDQGFPSGKCSPRLTCSKHDGSRAARPVIAKAPRKISYRRALRGRGRRDPREIASVVLLRSDHNTHSLTTGDRYVKLAFPGKSAKTTRASFAGQGAETARAGGSGIYMLFVVDRNGVPSVGRRVDLKPETRGRDEGDHDDDE